MGMIFRSESYGNGTWFVSSDSQPRWNKSGHGHGSVMAGGPPEIQEWIDACTENFGPPPEDLEYGFMKN